MAKAFEEEYKFNTKLILRDYDVKKFVDKFYPNRNQDIVLTDINCSVSDVVSELIIFERGI